MRARPRYVFDTNVLVSAALLKDSLPGQAFRRALQAGQLVLSLPVLEELSEVLRREKLQRYLSPITREEFLEALVERAHLVEPFDEIHACRDPADDKFLELAVAGEARCIVTGDGDLLELHPFHGISILTPREFLATH
jgi:putative PIN family toxin of toxin-antitoxin system